MALIEWTTDDKIAILSMNSGENRFNPGFLTEFLAVLDEIEQNTDANALVVKSNHEKIFSNGIDLDWLLPTIQTDVAASKSFLHQLNELFKRMLLYPMITIAAITGHAFAGGAMLCCAFDFRFMRADRGFLCLPEVDLKMPFLPGMTALIKKAVPMYMCEEMQLTAKRLTAQECEKHHIIRKACSLDEIMDEAVSFAKGLNKDRKIVAKLKEVLHADIIRIMETEDPPIIEAGGPSIS